MRTWCVFPLTTSICPVNFDRLPKPEIHKKVILLLTAQHLEIKSSLFSNYYSQVPSIKSHYCKWSTSAIKVMNEPIGWLHNNIKANIVNIILKLDVRE